MGNNPTSSLDADGGDDVYFNKDGSYSHTVDTNWFIDTFIGHRGYLEGNDGNFSRIYFNDPADALQFGKDGQYDGLKLVNDTYIGDILDERLGRFRSFEKGSQKHFYEDLAIASGARGSLDFGGVAAVEKLTVYGGRAFNQKDFGNFLWGAALQSLKVPYNPTTKIGSEVNGFWNGKEQNNQWHHGQSYLDRITWRGDTSEDQNAIRNGYNWGIKHRGLNEFRFY